MIHDMRLIELAKRGRAGWGIEVNPPTPHRETRDARPGFPSKSSLASSFFSL
jgi:hypothetical protein